MTNAKKVDDVHVGMCARKDRLGQGHFVTPIQVASQFCARHLYQIVSLHTEFC